MSSEKSDKELERERLLKIGDQIVAQWERLEQGGRITENKFEDVPPSSEQVLDQMLSDGLTISANGKLYRVVDAGDGKFVAVHIGNSPEPDEDWDGDFEEGC